MTAEDGDARPLYTIQAYFDGKLTVEDFARTGEDRPTTPHDVFDETLPVVDVAAIKDGSEEQRQANIALMLQAAKSWGFFRIANHGVPLQVVFALPMERKLSVRVQDFTTGIQPGLQSSGNRSGHGRRAGRFRSSRICWTIEVRSSLKAFFTSMHELSRFVVEKLSEALGLRCDAFTRLELTHAISSGRINHYFVCSDPDSVLGIPHGDTQMVTILHQDDAGGLQVLKDGKWVGIQPDDSTFVVNIGDTFMALTNSILHSAAHRAVVNAKEDRYSIVYFYGIDKSITLTVPPELTLTIALSSTGFSQS